MKQYFFLVLLAVSQVAFGQNMEYRNTISVQSGRSFFVGLRGKSVTPKNDTLSFTGGKIRATPSIQAAYDFAVAGWCSIGLVAGYNQATIAFDDITVRKKIIGNASAKVARTSLAARILFHYGNKSKFDMYSGGRIGVGLWTGNIGAEVNDAVFTDLLSSIELGWVPNGVSSRLNGGKLRGGFALPQVQFIPFGMRYFITDNLGVNGELAFGGPYWVSLGANYRF